MGWCWGDQKLIAKCGGITPLVSLLTDGAPEAQETSAGALHSLADLPANRVGIADAGGVPALAALLEHGTAEAKSEAAAHSQRSAHAEARLRDAQVTHTLTVTTYFLQ